jgi:hypothetical protein
MDADDGRQRIAALSHASAQVAERVAERYRRRGRCGCAEFAFDPLAAGVGRKRDAATKPPVLALPVPQPLKADESGAGKHSEREKHRLLKLVVLAARRTGART